MTTSAEDVYRDFQLVERWADRPFFRSARPGDYGEGQYSGRADYLEQLKNFFVFGGGGTALISGYRGVGKTATVDQALLKAMDAIREENNASSDRRKAYLRTNVESELERAQIDRLRSKELIVLKLDFGQIAMQAAATRATASRAGVKRASSPQPTEIDAKQVLIEIIKGLHRYFDGRVPTRQEVALTNQLNRLQARFEASSEIAQEVGAGTWPVTVVWWQRPLFWVRRATAPPKPSSAQVHGRAGALRNAARSQIYATANALLLPLDRGHRARGRRRVIDQRRKPWWTDVAVLMDNAMLRASSQTYREETARALSDEIVRKRTLSGGLEIKKLLPFLASVVAAVGATISVPVLVPFLPAIAIPSGLVPLVQVLAGAVVGTIGISMSARYAYTRTSKSSDAIKLNYARDASIASLKRDVEEILRLLESQDAPKDFRVVVILDELDKLDQKEMLDNVIQHFKNLFTLNRCVFVFITDRDYFDYVDSKQDAAIKIKTYAAQHTFFTLKMFLRRPDSADIIEFMKQVRYKEIATPREQAVWDEMVRYLTFESRCHFFDLMTLLNELVEFGTPDESTSGVSLSKRNVPRLLFTHTRVPDIELQRRAVYQRMIEMVYQRDSYAGHVNDHLNNELLAALYAVFDNLAYSSFPDPGERVGNNVNEEATRPLLAQRDLVRLLCECGALMRVGTNGASRLVWTRGRIREPDGRMLPIPRGQERLTKEVEETARKWQSFAREATASA